MLDRDLSVAVTGRLLKVEGAGNDFLLSVDPELVPRIGRSPGLVERLCDRRRGVGADGVLVIEVRGGDRVLLHYWNGDGTPAAFCANGTRCAAAVAHAICHLPASLVVQTGWGEIPAFVGGDGSVRLQLPDVRVDRALCLNGFEDELHAHTVSVGVPHAVVTVSSQQRLARLVPVAPTLRWNRVFGPDGCNVHLMTGAGEDVLVRSWERGLSEEPLSCGSGVVAAAAVWLHQHDGDVVRARTLGNDILTVRRCSEGRLELEGPTSIVAWVEPILRDDPEAM